MSNHYESSKKSKDPGEKTPKVKVSASKKKDKTKSEPSIKQSDSDNENAETLDKPMHLLPMRQLQADTIEFI